MSEAQLAAQVVEWLQEQHLPVYQEVRIASGSRTADIVVDVNGRAWVIECKKTFGFAVLEQAEWWYRHCASRVSVAVPLGRASHSRRFGERVCRQLGIGFITVGSSTVVEKLEPRFTRIPPARDLLHRCRPEHKTHAKAGTNSGGLFTPYQATMKGVRRFLEQNGPSTIRQIIDSVLTHYETRSAARSCLGKNLIESQWAVCEQSGRAFVFSVREEKPDTDDADRKT